jgi:hypothetical protein
VMSIIATSIPSSEVPLIMPATRMVESLPYSDTSVRPELPSS